MRDKFIALSCMLFSGMVNAALSNNQVPVSDKACEYLVGIWKGSHIYEKTGAVSNYQANYKKDGTLTAVVSLKEPNKPLVEERQDGTWSCLGDLFTNTIVNQRGETSTYLYRMLEITPSYRKYQNFSEDKLGPIFEATRVDKEP